MHRLPGPKRLFLAVFLPLWLGCLSLVVRDVVRGSPYPALVVEAASGPHDYPKAAGWLPGWHPDAGPEPGDRVVAVGGRDLRGASLIGWRLAFEDAAAAGPVELDFEHAGARRHAALVSASYARYWPRTLASLAFGVSALLLVRRAPWTPMARAFVFAYAAAALFFACTFSGGGPLGLASIALHVASLALAAPLGLRCALLFPHGVRPLGALASLGPWLFSSVAFFDASRFYGVPFSPHVGAVGSGVLSVAYLGLALAILTRTYRRADAIARRQIRWVLLGAYAAAAPIALAGAAAALEPRLQGMVGIAASSLALIPISQMIAVARYNLFDVDRLISSTAVYSLLLVVLMSLLVGFTSSVADPVGRATGLGAPAAQVALAAILAAFVAPVQRALRPRIERRFFAELHALERGVESLLDELAACDDPERLLRVAGERLDALLQPAALAIYARAGEGFAPTVVWGADVSTAIDPGDPLIATLERLTGCLAASTRAERATLPPFSRAALEALDARCVVPVRRAGALFAFLTLGARRSGDLYTPSDLALLAGVAGRMSDGLDRFDQERLLGTTRALAAELRRFVPGPLAERLGRGQGVDLGAADVSVVFVDLRGYSAYAEDLPPERIFSTVNRYTRGVSAAIARHGGTVVEFGGDGMMAVFGAPEPLPRKELAALEAAEDVLAAVAALVGEDGASLGVGVGIATGPAWVGSIGSADRLLWTALGNTTNLASRLQALTRELGVPLVIDEPTWHAAGHAAGPFQCHPDVAIRGRRRPETVYALPQGAAWRATSLGNSRGAGSA